MVVEVEAYSGYKADERPLRFRAGGQWHEVRKLLDRWYSPGAAYYKVRVEHGDVYILRLEEKTGEWSLEAYRSAQLRGE